MSTPTPQEVLDVFGELTGIRFRYSPDTVLRQAAEFAKHFTFAEMEGVILWTKWAGRTERISFNAQSISWMKLMGEFGASNAFVVFQERLGMAEDDWKARRFRYVPNFKGNARVDRTAAVAPNAAEKKTTENTESTEKIRREAAEALKRFKL